MAYWAELNEENIVVRVLATSNDEPDEGEQWLADTFGGRWLKTSYNTQAGVHLLGGTPFRGNYAGAGYSYDEALDAFIPPKPSGDYVLDESSFQWVPVEQ